MKNETFYQMSVTECEQLVGMVTRDNVVNNVRNLSKLAI